MQKYINYIALALLTISCHSKSGNKLSSIEKLPAFKILSVDSSICLNSENMNYGCPLVFIYFSPDCEHCQREMKGIILNKGKFKDVKFFLVTNDSFSDLRRFYKEYDFIHEPDFFLGKDYNYSFYNAFLPQAVPYIVIYNGSKKLIKLFKEEIDINSLAASIQR